MEMRVAKISAAVMAYQMPSTPRSRGRRMTEDVWNTSVRKNEMAAEISPLPSAVKNDEAKMLNPANKNAKENSRNAWHVSVNSPSSYPTKIFASGAASTRASTVSTTPEALIRMTLMRSMFLSSG